MKTPAMESGRLSSIGNLETAAILENVGGCCEGTVFTFTSAGSRWRLRQRLNRNKASVLCPPGGLLHREDPADSVFTEMRIMPRSSEPNPSVGVGLWNRNKVLSSVTAADSSRANTVINYQSSDLKDNCTIKTFTGEVGDQEGKIFSKEGVKAEHERRELQISTEETTPRKSRRYLRCDSSRGKNRYGDAAEDHKIWTWNEKKLQEVRAQELSEVLYKSNKPAEERRNKRESSAEEIHVFEQRKVKCRRREQDTGSTHSESLQNEDTSQSSDKRGNNGFNHRQGAPEDPRKQQAVPVAAISPLVGDRSTKSRRGPSIESPEDIENNGVKNTAKQKPVFELHIPRSNVTEENRSWMTPRPSTPPIACSFISLKRGVSCVGNRRCHLLENASLRAQRLPDVERRATVTYDANEIQSQILIDKKSKEDNRHSLSISPTRILEVFPRKSIELRGDPQIETGKTGKPEASDDLKSTGREREGFLLSETVKVVPFHRRPLSKELSFLFSLKATEGSLERGGDALSRWERSHGSISKPEHSSVNKGEPDIGSVDVFQLQPQTVQEGPCDRFSSKLLDFHVSREVEDDLETTDFDGNLQNSKETGRDDGFAPEKEENGTSSAGGRLESRHDICEGLLGGMNNIQSTEGNSLKPSGVPNNYIHGGTAELEETLGRIASNNLWKSTIPDLQNHGFRGIDLDIPSTERSWTARSEIIRTELIDLDPLPQKSVPLRRQPWGKGFKKKTAEKVSYFESWLGRSKKLHKTSSGRKCGPKGDGELPQANRIVDKNDKSRPLGHSIDQHLISQAWSKKENEAYVTKDFKILEAVLQSEVNIDNDESEVADYLQNASIRYGAGRGRVSEEETCQEGENVPGKLIFQEVDAVSMSTTKLETEANLAQLKCRVGDDLCSERGEYPRAENWEQVQWANMSRICKNVAKVNSCGEQKSSHMGGFSNSTDNQAKESRQNEREDLRVIYEKVNARNTGLAEQRVLLGEKETRNQARNMILAHEKIAETFKPFSYLTVLDDSRDSSTNKVSERRDFVVGEMNTGDSFGAVATEISDLADHTNISRGELNNFYPSHVTSGSGNRSVVASLVQIDSLSHLTSNRASSACSQQVPLPVQETSVSEFFEPGNEVTSSSVKMVQSSREVVDGDSNFPPQSLSGTDVNQSRAGALESKSLRVMVGFEDKESADVPSFRPEGIYGFGCLEESETTQKTVTLESSSVNFTSEVDFDHFPLSTKAPTEKEISGAERKVNRRHKMPIIVRVKNRLANGWLLQHPLWKRVSKRKTKTDEAQTPAKEGTNQNDFHANPSNSPFGRSFAGDFPKVVNESRTENAIDSNPPSNHDTELTGVSKLNNFILGAHYQTCTKNEIEKSHQGSFGDVDSAEYYLSIDDMEKPAAKEKYEILTVQQNQVDEKQAPSRNDDEVERDHTKKDDCVNQASPVLSFAEWQSRAKELGKSSPLRKRNESKSVSAVKESKRDLTELGQSKELNDCGELVSVVCLGSCVKEATVLRTFSDFDARHEIPMELSQGKEERDSAGSTQVSVNVCRELTPGFSRGTPQKLSAVSQTSSDCCTVEHIFNSSSDTTTSSSCQTEPVAETKVREQMEIDVPANPSANFSSKNCCINVKDDAKSESSQECHSLLKYLSLHDQKDDLHTCSMDQPFEIAPHIAERIQMPYHSQDSIGDQPQHGGPSDALDSILGSLTIECTVGQSAEPAPLQGQPGPGSADKEQHKALSTVLEAFGQARVVVPFSPPVQVTSSCGNEMARGDDPVRQRSMEDLRVTTSHMRNRQDDPAISCSSSTDKSSGNMKQWEIMEMLNLPSSQPQLLSGERLKDLSDRDDEGHVYQAGSLTNTCERSGQRVCGGNHGTLCWRDVAALQIPNDDTTEDEIFLQRFSATPKSLKSREVSKGGLTPTNYSNLGIELLGQSYNSYPVLSSQTRVSSAPGRPTCGRAESLYFERCAESAFQPPDVPSISSLPQYVSTRSSLGEAGRLHSSQADKHDNYNTFEGKNLPDYVASLDCTSPSSSINRSLDHSERHFSWARPCTDCLNKYNYEETCVHCAYGMHDWKHSGTSGCFPSLLMHGSFPAQCQSLLLNARSNPRVSNMSQPSTQCRCDHCSLSCRFSPPVLLGCHHPPCIDVVKHHNQCHFPASSHVPVPSDQSGKFQHTSTPSLHGQNLQCPKKDTLPQYVPLQVIKPSGTCRPMSYSNSEQPLLPLERHPFADKIRVTQDDQVGGKPKGSELKEISREQELVWLGPEEMNFIQQLRLSGEMAKAACKHNAAACIQRYWRKFLEKKTEDLNVENEQQIAISCSFSKSQIRHDHLQYFKLHQELRQEKEMTTSYRTKQNAARIIQRAWRSVLRTGQEKMLAEIFFPKDLKNFYDIIKSRHVARGRLAPSYALFAKSVERIQAATEGARVRRRLKSHRLQTIIMEIREIRMLLCEMSQEENCNSAPFLFPQLCTQLRQKILQLHAALNGKQMEARFLLRRCPATPLTLHQSRSTSPKPICLIPYNKSLDQALTRLPSGTVGARKYYAPPLTIPASDISDSRIAQNDTSTIQSALHAQQKFVHTQSFVPLIQGSKGNATHLRKSSPDQAASADTPDSAKLLQWYFLAQRTPSERNTGQGTPTDFRSGQEALVKKASLEILDPSQNKCDLSFSSQKAFAKSKDPDDSLNKSFDEQPLPVPQRSIPKMSFEEMVVGGSNASMYMTEYAPSSDSIDKPKRPFLKRKSRVMPPQKLDWSKVKPMVSSRLEPELKTKLSLCKGLAKEPMKNNSKKKANYTNVKSRLFSYEENVSPSNITDGTCLDLQSTEGSEAGYPPMLMGRSRESRSSSIQGTESGRNSRVLANRQRAVSPDLMRLRRMAGAERHCSQTSMVERQSVATYSSHFNSARYLQKLENTEERPKRTLIGSCQQRTQRIRLRLVPRSKESELGDLFVQEEVQEMWEDRSLSADGKGKRQQSHSHRYAIYQDATYSSEIDDSSSPDCVDEDRNVTGRASRKVFPRLLKSHPHRP